MQIEAQQTQIKALEQQLRDAQSGSMWQFIGWPSKTCSLANTRQSTYDLAHISLNLCCAVIAFAALKDMVWDGHWNRLYTHNCTNGSSPSGKKVEMAAGIMVLLGCFCIGRGFDGSLGRKVTVC